MPYTPERLAKHLARRGARVTTRVTPRSTTVVAANGDKIAYIRMEDNRVTLAWVTGVKPGSDEWRFRSVPGPGGWNLKSIVDALQLPNVDLWFHDREQGRWNVYTVPTEYGELSEERAKEVAIWTRTEPYRPTEGTE